MTQQEKSVGLGESVLHGLVALIIAKVVEFLFNIASFFYFSIVGYDQINSMSYGTMVWAVTLSFILMIAIAAFAVWVTTLIFGQKSLGPSVVGALMYMVTNCSINF